MENAITNPAVQHQEHCEVCGCEMSYLDYLNNENSHINVCRSLECKRIIGNKSTMSEWQFKSYLSFQKEQLQKHKKQQQIRKKQIEQAELKQAAENRQSIELLLDNTADFLEEIQQAVTIPSGLSDITAANEERINRYTEHLKNIISEAAELSSVNDVVHDQHMEAKTKRLQIEKILDKNPALNLLSEKLCTECKGGCCIAGAEHAYLSVFTIRTMMDANPHYSTEDILDLYLSHISPQSVKGSCINQTDRGCALPRDLRSDICNGFFCEPLKSFHRNLKKQKNIQKIIAIQRSEPYSSTFNPDVDNPIVNVFILAAD